MSYEPPKLEVSINQFAAKTFAKPYHRDFVNILNLKGNEKVLDYGSGPGGPANLIAKKLSKGNGSLTCVDISQRWLECAKKMLSKYRNVDFHLGHISKVDVKSNEYDIIGIHFVIHDIPESDRNEIAASLADKLKKGGLLYMREPVSDIKQAEKMMGLFEKAGMKQVYMKDVKVPLSGRTIEMCMIK
jgi:ubiquinone/menaquinone biosynthesis C-methylase UbiE